MAETHVLKLVVSGNRPFSLQNVIDLSQTAGFKKAQCQKALDSLAESGKISAKDFGKTKIYVAPQAGLPVLSKEEMDAKREQIKVLQAEMSEEGTLVRQLEAELGELKSSLTDEQIAHQLADLTQKTTAAEAKLAPLRTGAVLISAAERSAAEKVLMENMNHWRKRKAMFKNIWGAISEGVDGKQADLFEEIGVETDEAAGYSYDDIAQFLPGNKKRKF